MDDSGNPWWNASEIGKVLEHSNLAMLVKRLDEDEKVLNSIYTPGGPQDTWFVNESGLYNLIMGSRKKEAKAFKRWVTHEVLPAIRKTGKYEVPKVHDPALQALITMSEQVKTLVVELDATRQVAHAAEEKAVRAETKADLALEDAHYMTVKEFIGKNGLLRQFPVPQHSRIGAWLKRYCLQYGIPIRSSPVHGESWEEENSYKVDVFYVWLKWEQTKPQQQTLRAVAPERKTT
jgi:prophage antirepressor-like protein